MDPSHRGWPPPPQQAGGNAHGSNAEQSQPSRPTFGAGQQSPPQGHNGLPPPPPGGPFPHFHPQQPSLATLAGLSQSSPRAPPPSTGRPDGSQQGPSAQLPPLPNYGQATGQPGAAERERERERVEQIHIKEEEDRRHREQERQRIDQAPPHHQQQHSGPPLPLHQPVAVGPRSFHGPNGLLGNPGQPQPQMPLGAPSGPGNIFAGGPVQQASQSQGPAGQPMQPSMLMPFGPGQPPQPAPPQQVNQQQGQGQGQGQQPILNDALSYLDQVKVQFAEVPDVYNRFLDIMKDFKSGAIDTPGVIGRVSTLFAGNPELIQGFNTFLPPGYRIECGADNDPNTIRVTTPMGTTVRAMPQPRPLSRQEGEQDPARSANGTFTPQPGPATQMVFSPSGRPVGPAAPAQQQQHLEVARQQEQQAMHQQEQRGVNSLSNAASAAASNAGLRAAASPTSTPLPGPPDPIATSDGPPGQSAMEKRGPVEFNHAISYVNKIKNRFASHPDIYKQFLEILQTYQRESKPIQDVYSQVTHLFKTAPDLLEDFKQFLPESAAQAKAAERARQQAEEGAMLSNVRGEGGGLYTSPIISREPHGGTPTYTRTNLPPVGNFAPTPVSKNNKRKMERQGTATAIDTAAGPSGGKMSIYGAQTGKRLKQTHAPVVKGPGDQPPSSPTLIPRLPEPLPPTTTSAATHEELSFFDRAKKAIGNKNTMNEFLKLCNLFSMDFIDRSTLVYRAKAFIGNNPDLMKWFSDFVGYDEKDIIIDNKAREPLIPGGRIALSNCRGLGPSYRLLPKRERNRPCSGRDELCNSVLNDVWASHPTWASEDSGFIAHRKNLHEEGLHRIEEERHDYDYNIEACSRTIQLLEPIAQQLRRMSNDEQTSYKLPPGLGGQSETIYQRVIMKLYGRDKGHDVIQQLHIAPYQVIPVLLNRLKERLETWKMAQREWEKVWREQTQKMFWKSLDHQAANVRTTDRRHFQSKALQAEMQVKLEEQKKEESKIAGSTSGQAQITTLVADEDVVVDAAWLVLVHVESTGSTDSPRLGPFLKDFVPTFFGIPAEEFERKLSERRGIETAAGAMAVGDELGSGAEDSSSEKRTKKNGKQSTLLRQTLDKGSKGRPFGRREREDSNASASRASTPGPNSDAGDDTGAVDGMAVDLPGTGISTPGEDAQVRATEVSGRWFTHPETGNMLDSDRNVDPNEQHKRSFYRLWANAPIYCFMRMFLILYERLYRLKLCEQECRDIVRNAKKIKPAFELGIVDKLPQEFFADTSSTANYYQQMLHKFYDVLQQELDFTNDGVEDCLRRFYLQAGYPLYMFEKMVQALARYGSSVVSIEGGNKEKSWDIINLWKKDKARGDEINAQQTMDYRKAAEKLIGVQEAYAIDWSPTDKIISYYLVKKDDKFATAPSDGLSELDSINEWRDYIISYASVDPTEGVDPSSLSKVALHRNLAVAGADPTSNMYQAPTAEGHDAHDGPRGLPNPQVMERIYAAVNDEALEIRVALDRYAIRFQPGTAEAYFQPPAARQGGKEGVERTALAREMRAVGTETLYIKSNEAVRGLGVRDVEVAENSWEKLIGETGVKVEEGGNRNGNGQGDAVGDGDEGMEIDA